MCTRLKATFSFFVSLKRRGVTQDDPPPPPLGREWRGKERGKEGEGGEGGGRRGKEGKEGEGGEGGGREGEGEREERGVSLGRWVIAPYNAAD